MQGKRTARVAHLIQKELSQLILTRIKDPRLGFVTVTHVDITPDLKYATVFYSVMGNDKIKEDSQLALSKASGFLQHEIGDILKLRYTPKLLFKFDDSLDQGFAIDRVLKEIKDKEGHPASGEFGVE
ncbi:MAG: 30S ribosome-binding factor RbfA [Candidatus Omnitrophica bacterium]|nr:30S ribosome-binding factor RbfA [Candidatus Omnitrophota bacterium]MDD5671661.1 30S ribosome-binding factor RbfA [Candidatus Omnitrophota bacterium]